MEAQFTQGLKPIFEEGQPPFWIAGGAVLSVLIGERVNDYDLFSPDAAPVIEWFKNKGGVATFENDFFCNIKWRRKKLQVIKKYQYASMKETIDNFDFTCVSAAYDGKELVSHERFFLDAAQKRLVINAMPRPLNTIKRALKYSGRGFKMCPVGLAQCLKAINTTPIDWDNPDQNVIEFYPDGTPTFRGLD